MVKDAIVIASIDRTIKLRKRMAGIFYVTATGPRMILEVFIRKNLGQRYFSFGMVISIFLVFLVIPFFFPNSTLYGYKFDLVHEVWQNLPWFIFTGAFLAAGIQRRKEIKRRPSVFKFESYTLYEGDIHPFFLNTKIKGEYISVRDIVTVYEPLVGVSAGVLFMLLGAKALGFVVILCGILYSISYRASLFLGDNEILDLIDQKIAAEGVSEVMEKGAAKSSKGYRPNFTVPSDPEARQNIYNILQDDKDTVDVY